MTRPRVLLADDHVLVLEGLAKLLEDRYELVAKVQDGRTLVRAAQELQPDVMIVDISLPHLNGLDAAKQIVKLNPKARIIFLTMHAEPAYAREAFQLGASGFLLKRSAAGELPQAIEAALKGQIFITPAIAKDLLDVFAHSRSSSPLAKEPLTTRQREVLQLMAEGHTTKSMASMLHVSIKTIEFHRAQIMRALDLHSTAELTRYAITHGLISPDS